MYYVYILKSKKKNWLYTGYTSNLRRRFNEHNLGITKATKPYRPFEIIFYEAFRSVLDAKRREGYLKTIKGKRTLKLMLKEGLLNKDDK